MDNTQITENLNSFIAELQRLKPASSKGIYLKDIYLSTSMGPGYKIDVSQF
jgi:large subunit ribosomal protein L1